VENKTASIPTNTALLVSNTRIAAHSANLSHVNDKQIGAEKIGLHQSQEACDTEQARVQQ